MTAHCRHTGTVDPLRHNALRVTNCLANRRAMSDFAKAVLALTLPLPGDADTCRIPLPSRMLRRAWRGAYERLTLERERAGAR